MNLVHEKTFWHMQKLWKTRVIHDRIQVSQNSDGCKKLDRL